MTEDLQYTTKLEASNKKVYDEVTAFLGRMTSVKRKHDIEFTYYFLDRKSAQVIRTNQQDMSIEITEQTPQNKVDLIKHILKSEIMAV